jgi:DNA (cytosine-5)-methyltransferase 1
MIFIRKYLKKDKIYNIIIFKIIIINKGDFMEKKKLKVATVFSGIGAFEHALQRMNIPHEIVFACDNGDVDIFGKKIDPEYENIILHIKNAKTLLKEISDYIKSLKFESDEEKSIKDNFKEFKKSIETELKQFETDLKTLGNACSKDSYRKTAEYLGMTFEKLNSYLVELKISMIKDDDKTIMYKKRKEYIDSLYSKKEKQNKVKQSYFANYDITNEHFHWNVKLLDGNQYKDEVDIFVGGSPCFVAGTKVYTKYGYKNIETLRVGDEVLTHKNKFEKVLRIGNTPNSEIWEVISEDDEIFLTTSNHPFMTTHVEEIHYTDYEFKEVKDLNYDDYLVGPMIGFTPGNKENHYTHTKIKSIRNTGNKATVYNIEVANDHTYMVETKFVHNCQAFSSVGKRRGFEDTRGTLFYEYARLVKEIQPKVFIYENVKGLLNHDKGNTWKTIQAVFDEIGYNYSFKLMNSKDYGIPQSRPRIFVVGFRKDLDLKKDFEFPESFELSHKMKDFLLENVSGKYYLTTNKVKFVLDENRLKKKFTQIDGEIALCQTKHQQYNLAGDFVFIEKNADMEKTMQDLDKYFLSEKMIKNVMSTGTKNYHIQPKTDRDVAATLLKTMHKMHRAGIDNYVTTEGRLRKLTPRECLRLMGFCDSFKIVVSDTPAYMQAGNSIVVDVLMYIMSAILDSYDFDLELKDIKRPSPKLVEKIFEKQDDGSYIEVSENDSDILEGD